MTTQQDGADLWPVPVPPGQPQPPKTRLDRFHEVLKLDALASAFKAAAAEVRAALNAEARAEYEQHRTAVSWRMDIGVASLPISKETAMVGDDTALLKWCRERYPTEVEDVPQIRTSFQAQLLRRVMCRDGLVLDPDTGEAVPGLVVRPGGVPKTLTFRPDDTVQDLYAGYAEGRLVELRNHGSV
jgi:hypothetical protein